MCCVRALNAALRLARGTPAAGTCWQAEIVGQKWGELRACSGAAVLEIFFSTSTGKLVLNFF